MNYLFFVGVQHVSFYLRHCYTQQMLNSGWGGWGGQGFEVFDSSLQLTEPEYNAKMLSVRDDTRDTNCSWWDWSYPGCFFPSWAVQGATVTDTSIGEDLQVCSSQPCTCCWADAETLGFKMTSFNSLWVWKSGFFSSMAGSTLALPSLFVGQFSWKICS